MYVTAKIAINAGLTACPVCDAKALELDDEYGAPQNTAVIAVYIGLGQSKDGYYHAAASCEPQAFFNGTCVTLEYALARGLAPCPSCVALSADDAADTDKQQANDADRGTDR